MKRLCLILFFTLPVIAYSQAKAGLDKVVCNGTGVEIGDMEDDGKSCYSWKATPEDPAVANAKSPKIKVNPAKTTTYTLTVIGDGFSTVSTDDVKVFVTKVKLKDVSFTENLDVVKDDGSASFTAPHWKEGEMPSPVCFKAGNAMKLSANIEVDEELSSEVTVKVKGSGSGGMDIDPATATISGKKINLPATPVLKAFPLQVDYMDAFDMNWEISFDDGKNWCTVGSSKNQLYVTLNAPAGGVTLFHTVLHLGCKNAKGQTTESGIFTNVWPKFKNRDVFRADGTPLMYYNNWETQNYGSTLALLSNGDAQCSTWATLLLDILKAHGIQRPLWYVQVDNPNAHGFLVKNWTFTGNGTSGSANFPYLNVAINSIVLDANGNPVLDANGNPTITEDEILKSSYNWLKAEVKDATGIPGQGTSNPLSYFNNHQFIAFDGKYYDPSYGTEGSTIDAVEANSIDGFYIANYASTVFEAYESTDFNGDGDMNDIYIPVYIKKNASIRELREARGNH